MLNILTRHKNSFNLSQGNIAITDSSVFKIESYYVSCQLCGIWNKDYEYHFRITPGLYQQQFEIFRCDKFKDDGFSVRYNGWVFDSKKDDREDFANKIFDYFFSPIDKFENAGGYSLNLTNDTVQTSRRNIVEIFSKCLNVAINELELF